MSKDLNQCNFIGRLGKDVELRYMPSGKAVANFSLACGDDYKDKETGQKVEQTNWIKVSMFGRPAEVIAEYCKKGSRLFVTGKQVTRKWQDKDGNDRYSTEIIASEFQMLDTRSVSDSGQSDTQRQEAVAGETQGGGDFSDDIPFAPLRGTNAY